LRAITFRPPPVPPASGATVSVVYQVDRRVYAGQVRIELRLEDVRPTTR
jgi:hypothetical protein